MAKRSSGVFNLEELIMKKVFLIHGFQGSPAGGWRPWLMRELEKEDIYACALSMPNPDHPILEEWIEEIARHVEQNKDDEIFLVGHSLGASAILRYLDTPEALPIEGVVLASGPIEKTENKNIANFLEQPFDFADIQSKVKKVVVIHGDNDPNVPLAQAETVARELGAELIVIENGKHLNGSAGFNELPQALKALNEMMA